MKLMGCYVAQTLPPSIRNIERIDLERSRNNHCPAVEHLNLRAPDDTRAGPLWFGELKLGQSGFSRRCGLRLFE
jgi:hypothetical protein